MGSADEWARSLGEQIKTKERDSNGAAHIAAMNRNIVAEQTPLVWDELCAEFQKYCDAINGQVKPERELGFHRTGAHDFMVRPDAMDPIVLGHYAYDTHYISIRTGRGVEWFAPSVYHVGMGKVVLISTSTRSSTTPGSIARKALGYSFPLSY